MLPFLKNLKEVGSMSSTPDSMSRTPDEGSDYDSLESAAEDLMNAVHSKDIKGIAAALRAAFELVDSQPHVEGEHE
jgi:hypothetical protein